MCHIRLLKARLSPPHLKYGSQEKKDTKQKYCGGKSCEKTFAATTLLNEKFQIGNFNAELFNLDETSGEGARHGKTRHEGPDQVANTLGQQLL